MSTTTIRWSNTLVKDWTNQLANDWVNVTLRRNPNDIYLKKDISGEDLYFARVHSLKVDLMICSACPKV
ncbi:hypothetical protein DFA_02419 [Cavenderia fasciculata]|uniref:Uncharacterized protein n=1 Tax=Cavenderia fasciculata TaxID=261658 RepID=F4PZE2_CACFS|nr:uncharacterized protein DFA_02419 [Cavenderia fasciculata]EGG19171.1 hypothetical protein DFA_02419 [Cavenderia fasciculata]|eukprot:XP_004366804.1 hypothetical protein DFA_02419 [Cavenderia fasciculata]